MTFITQEAAGGRACADIIYSGHMAMLTLMIMAGADAYGPGESSIVHWLVSFTLGSIAFGLLVRCQDHYTVDLVLGVGIAFLLYTCEPLKSCGRRLASLSYKLECRLLGGAEIGTKVA